MDVSDGVLVADASGFSTALNYTGGTLQVVAGGALCSTAIGCALGAPLMTLGANNLYEAYTGDTGLVRDYLDYNFGEHTYFTVDIGVSLLGGGVMAFERVGMQSGSQFINGFNNVDRASDLYNYNTNLGRALIY
nr:DUF4225 domain-containing protein [Campylobacterota bacterium]